MRESANIAPSMVDVPDTVMWYPAPYGHDPDQGELAGGGWYTSSQSFKPERVRVPAYSIQRYEVTNGEFRSFLEATGYWPTDDHNFVRHWVHGKCPETLEQHPVRWVSLEDARAYAKWKGQRLPSDVEWQLAGQGPNWRPWPWGFTLDAGRCNVSQIGTTPVSQFPEGVSPFGVCDLIGNVWEWTESEGFDGAHRYCHLRGGSYYDPRDHSHWYGPGGGLELHRHRKILLLSPGFDRSGTVGFRCAL